MTDQQSDMKPAPLRPMDEGMLEELRRSRGDKMRRPSEQEPPPPHYSGSRANSRTRQYGQK